MEKKYCLHVENDRVVAVEVNGEVYKKPASITNAADRAVMQHLVRSFPKEEVMEEQTQAKEMVDLIVKIFTGVALLMLFIAAVSGVMTAVSLSKEKLALGTVVEFSIRTDQEGYQLYYPIVEFALPDNMRQIVVLSEGSWPPAYQFGQQVTIAYQEDNLSRARPKSLESGIGIWLVTMITGVLGMTFGTTVYFIRRYF
jgi:hypothetical protein